MQNETPTVILVKAKSRLWVRMLKLAATLAIIVGVIAAIAGASWGFGTMIGGFVGFVIARLNDADRSSLRPVR